MGDARRQPLGPGDDSAGARRRLLDELAARATVSPIERDFDGWYAKAAHELPFRRCNAVLPPTSPLARGREAVSATVDAMEAWYADLGQRVIIQISSADPHAARLDDLLGERGYEVEAPVDLMVRPMNVPDHARLGTVHRPGPGSRAPEVSPSPVEVLLVEGLDEEWATRYAAAHGGDRNSRHRTESYGRMLVALGPSAIGASAAVGGEPAGVGFGVIDERWVGIFGMGTSPRQRRRGVAKAIVTSLIDRAAARGATGAYLQVETDNQPAIDLYSGIGFVRSHGYHYRVSAPPS